MPLNLQAIIYLVVGAFIGFLFKIIHGKIFEKKVRLFHSLDNPAVFSHIPPKICFQNLKIWNAGNTPAINLKVNLNADVIADLQVSYKAITEESYTEDKKDGVLTLKFERLLPRDNLVISFKSSDPAYHLLMSIKSDEVISEATISEVKSGSLREWIKTFTTVFILLAVIGFGYYTIKHPPGISPMNFDESIIPLKVTTDKNVYNKGQTMQVTYQVTNSSNELLRDVWTKVTIPGFIVDQKYGKAQFLEVGEKGTWEIKMPIPKNTPVGKHKIILNATAKTLDKRFENEIYAFFEVR